MINGVVGITIWTDNLERLRTFYIETLKLTLHSDHETFLTFQFGDVRLNLGYHKDVSGKTKDPYRTMINLAVMDIQEEYERLIEQGVQFIRPPQQEHWMGWVSTFKDPDGNILQLLEFPGGTTQPK